MNSDKKSLIESLIGIYRFVFQKKPELLISHNFADGNSCFVFGGIGQQNVGEFRANILVLDKEMKQQELFHLCSVTAQVTNENTAENILQFILQHHPYCDRINGLDAMFAFAGSKECGLPLMMVKLVDIMTGTRRESNSEKIGGLELLLKVLQHIESDHEYAILTDSLNAPTVEVLGDFSREERTAEDPPLECMENIADLLQESTDGSEEGHDNRLLQQEGRSYLGDLSSISSAGSEEGQDNRVLLQTPIRSEHPEVVTIGRPHCNNDISVSLQVSKSKIHHKVDFDNKGDLKLEESLEEFSSTIQCQRDSERPSSHIAHTVHEAVKIDELSETLRDIDSILCSIYSIHQNESTKNIMPELNLPALVIPRTNSQANVETILCQIKSAVAFIHLTTQELLTSISSLTKKAMNPLLSHAQLPGTSQSSDLPSDTSLLEGASEHQRTSRLEESKSGSSSLTNKEMHLPSQAQLPGTSQSDLPSGLPSDTSSLEGASEHQRTSRLEESTSGSSSLTNKATDSLLPEAKRKKAVKRQQTPGLGGPAAKAPKKDSVIEDTEH